ncbi:MAG: TonB-dependent receptor plug domain-containing protein [Cyanobacteria bacterium J06634_6]
MLLQSVAKAQSFEPEQTELLLASPMTDAPPAASAFSMKPTSEKEQPLSRTPFRQLMIAQTEPTAEPTSEPADTENEAPRIRLNVTGTRTPRPIQITPANVTVIEAQELDEQRVFGIEDLIRYEPGISVQNNLQFGAQDFNIRGIDGNRVLIQVDGIRLPPAFQSGSESTVGQGFNVGRDYFDLEILRTAEIIRGPASTLYGSDALGGAVSYFYAGAGSAISGGQQQCFDGTLQQF